jgi:hypothetical protein
MVFISSNRHTIKEVIVAIERFGVHWGILISKEKSELLARIKQEDKCEEIEGIKVVNACKYSRVKLSLDANIL